MPRRSGVPDLGTPLSSRTQPGGGCTRSDGWNGCVPMSVGRRTRSNGAVKWSHRCDRVGPATRRRFRSRSLAWSQGCPSCSSGCRWCTTRAGCLPQGDLWGTSREAHHVGGGKPTSNDRGPGSSARPPSPSCSRSSGATRPPGCSSDRRTSFAVPPPPSRSTRWPVGWKPHAPAASAHSGARGPLGAGAVAVGSSRGPSHSRLRARASAAGAPPAAARTHGRLARGLAPFPTLRLRVGDIPLPRRALVVAGRLG